MSKEDHFHYVSDVVAGLLLGWESILLCDKIIRITQIRHRREISKRDFSLDLVRST